MTAATNSERASLFLTLFSTQKIDEAFEMLHDDMVWTIWGSGPAARDYSKSEMKALLLESWKWFSEPVTWLPELILAEDDRVAVIANSRAVTHSGYEHRNHYHNLFRFRGDRISVIREMFPEPPVHRLYASLQSRQPAA